MLTNILMTRNGIEHDVDAAAGSSFMEGIRGASVDELLSICGGGCSCAACHVYVEEGGGALPPMSADKDDLFDSSDHRTVRSRLFWQLRAVAAKGSRMRVASED